MKIILLANSRLTHTSCSWDENNSEENLAFDKLPEVRIFLGAIDNDNICKRQCIHIHRKKEERRRQMREKDEKRGRMWYLFKLLASNKLSVLIIDYGINSEISSWFICSRQTLINAIINYSLGLIDYSGNFSFLHSLWALAWSWAQLWFF